jgi:dihydroorotate dehydrogenase
MLATGTEVVILNVMAEFSGRIGHLEGIESPWGNAGGVVKTIEDVEQMAHTGVGWIEVGSYTLEPRLGNSPNGERVYYHNDQTGETFNSLGMPNKGMDEVEKEIPEMVQIAHAHNKKLVVNIAPVSSDPIKETQELVARSYGAGADGVLVNAGCPNVVTEDGGRHEILSYDAGALGDVLYGLQEVVSKFRPVLVRTSPYKTYPDMLQALWQMQLTDVTSAVFLPNTWGGNRPTNYRGEDILEVSGGIGGKSGPAMAERSRIQTEWAIDLLKGTVIDVVSSSSIMNAGELKIRMDLGAVAGAGTTFFYESQNGWKEDTDRLLSELAEI